MRWRGWTGRYIRFKVIYNRDNESNAYYYGGPGEGVIYSVFPRGIIGKK